MRQIAAQAYLRGFIVGVLLSAILGGMVIIILLISISNTLDEKTNIHRIQEIETSK